MAVTRSGEVVAVESPGFDAALQAIERLDLRARSGYRSIWSQASTLARSPRRSYRMGIRWTLRGSRAAAQAKHGPQFVAAPLEDKRPLSTRGAAV
jgi:hypothetical protein